MIENQNKGERKVVGHCGRWAKIVRHLLQVVYHTESPDYKHGISERGVGLERVLCGHRTLFTYLACMNPSLILLVVM